MQSEKRRILLRNRILELRQALFFTLSSAVLRLPVSVVDVTHVDEAGQLWFLVHRPSQRLTEFEQQFPARLEFFKKGKDFHLHVLGMACLVTDPEEMYHNSHLPAEMLQQAQSPYVLIKVNVKETEYFPHGESRMRLHMPQLNFQPSAFIKTLHYIVKDIFPVFQSH